MVFRLFSKEDQFKEEIMSVILSVRLKRPVTNLPARDWMFSSFTSNGLGGPNLGGILKLGTHIDVIGIFFNMEGAAVKITGEEV